MGRPVQKLAWVNAPVYLIAVPGLADTNYCRTSYWASILYLSTCYGYPAPAIELFQL
jgi:hypothetical protein